MFKILIISIAVSVIGVYGQQSAYGQCGGKSWTGPTTCVSGYACQYSNDYYSQCLPSSNGGASNSGGVAEASLYAQCGGINWTGAKSCVSGSSCTYLNDYYYQCLPSSDGQAASTQAPATQAPSTQAPATQAPSTQAPTTAQTVRPTSGGSSSQQCPSTYVSNGNTFINNKFKVGLDYNYYTSNSNSVDMSQYDYISIWMNTVDGSGSTAWNPWYQGAMLDVCTKYGKTPLFYAYVIAFEARAMKGLQDCDVGSPNLCQQGSEFIRNNRQHLVDKYTEHATAIANRYGKTNPVIFVMEPDFWQYYGDVTTQQNGALSGTYMRDLFNDFVKAIKAQLPNALISWDISAWIGQPGFQEWWCYFKDSQIDFIHTSGGQAHGETASLKPGELNWSYVSSVTGKKIIADCGYGVAGGLSDNCGVWTNSANQNARISDGVVALSIANRPNSGSVSKPSLSCC